MNRRRSLQVLTAASAIGAAVPFLEGAVGKEPIQLHVELFVDPAREAEMVKNYHSIFKPVISKQPGFVDVKLIKMRSVLEGEKPKTAWRLLISFKTEEQRLTWVKTDDHQRVWPSIEKTLVGKKYAIVLYDIQ